MSEIDYGLKFDNEKFEQEFSRIGSKQIFIIKQINKQNNLTNFKNHEELEKLLEIEENNNIKTIMNELIKYYRLSQIYLCFDSNRLTTSFNEVDAEIKDNLIIFG